MEKLSKMLIIGFLIVTFVACNEGRIIANKPKFSHPLNFHRGFKGPFGHGFGGLGHPGFGLIPHFGGFPFIPVGHHLKPIKARFEPVGHHLKPIKPLSEPVAPGGEVGGGHP